MRNTPAQQVRSKPWLNYCLIEAAQKQQALPVSYQKQPEKWTADALFRLQTDTAEFNRSYRYYFSHPEKMNLVLVEAQAIW